ncbi:MAG TPA: hypothetical protein VLA88_03380 [Candidatus Saccharimonadales bacterium]|nr:hypothetical protein [Candidatus Saccharimonadales bacterium]
MFGIRTTPRRAGLSATAVVAALLALMGCQTGGKDNKPTAFAGSPTSATSAPEVTVTTDAPETAPTTPESDSPSSAPTTTPAASATIDATNPDAGGSSHMTAITTVQCPKGLPVSGVFVEGNGSEDKPPYGDLDIWDNQRNRLTVLHTVLPTESYKISFGCGYVKGADHEWEYGFETLPLFAPSQGTKHTIVCPKVNGKTCNVDGVMRNI